MAEVQQITEEKVITKPISFQWDENGDVKNLLDVVASILAEEYVEAVKGNPEVFS